MLDARSPELQAAMLGLRQTEPTVRKAINKDVREQINPKWQGALATRAKTKSEYRSIVAGARARTRADGFSLAAATSSKPLRGGMEPGYWQPFEFGAHVHKKTFTQRSRKGKAYSVTKRINAQFKPFSKQGRIGFDAASEVGTWAVARWVVSVVHGLADAARGKVQ